MHLNPIFADDGHKSITNPHIYCFANVRDVVIILLCISKIMSFTHYFRIALTSLSTSLICISRSVNDDYDSRRSELSSFEDRSHDDHELSANSPSFCLRTNENDRL